MNTVFFLLPSDNVELFVQGVSCVTPLERTPATLKSVDTVADTSYMLQCLIGDWTIFQQKYGKAKRLRKNFLSLATKLAMEIIRPYIDPLLRNNQNGFRQQRSTIALILTPRRLIEGDTLAPFLFIICLDNAMRTAIDDNTQLGFTLHQRKSRRQPAVTITVTDFADDIALLSDTIDDATTLLHKVEEAAQEIGLYINESKTEYICFGETGQIVAKNGINIKRVNYFQYLGSWLNTTKHDVEIRIAKAWTAHIKMKTIWRSNLSRSVKINFFSKLRLKAYYSMDQKARH
ncbi:uncharacterized protein LOC125032815 [Penaeus chinensis]|uniref:uncharacterized protein LOC125032815 n=1 Tax=Penaeus chinensis TaxID=139456 RepID=UPI001FB6AE55|nr:uncharacterized protein LOC125032815 [Penaeus chinensis]